MEESQDGRDQQNAGDVVPEVQKLVGAALTDNHVPSDDNNDSASQMRDIYRAIPVAALRYRTKLSFHDV